MRRLELSRNAVDDIAAIGRYTRSPWGAERARRYGRRLTDHLISLEQRARPGRARAEINPAVRSPKSDRHVIYVTLEEAQVLVVRIHHESMDPSARLAAGFASVGRNAE